ncbi:hypothetical protein [Cernens ardua]|uniref:hypothetical protein n=1 Tax=Cernens ardua TaxID=3402176 RepID=UPI003F9A30B5
MAQLFLAIAWEIVNVIIKSSGIVLDQWYRMQSWGITFGFPILEVYFYLNIPSDYDNIVN